jgi:BCD family chlorophyll transporter-like MFS transporter
MNLAPREQAGLALGAWGAVQATGAGLGVACSGLIRDLVNAGNAALGLSANPYAAGYLTVYALEAALLALTLFALLPLFARRRVDLLERGMRPMP